MRFVMFYHSLISDWNHGNAHFLRGVVAELRDRGHQVAVYEPRDGWSFTNLVAQHGHEPLHAFRRRFPGLESVAYDPAALDLERALAGADVVMVHEWSDPALVRALGAARRTGHFRLLFHDTHHRAVSDPEGLSRLDLGDYDAVLAFGVSLADVYRARRLARRVFVWHEAADVRVFRPPAEEVAKEGDVVWIGNFGDEERTAELEEFLLEPVRALGLRARVYGVRYPEAARAALARAGVEYGGWVANFQVPEVFARFRATVHVPRRPYVEALPGIPTIRVFEALACGIPLCSAPWQDREGLFERGRDYLLARDGAEMKAHLAWLLARPLVGRALGEQGRRTILARHTCGHRVDELFAILDRLGRERAASRVA